MRIREIRPEDAAEYVRLRCALDAETNMMLLEPGERDTDAERMRAHIMAAQRKGDFFMVAEEQGRLCGVVTAVRGTYRRIARTAYVVAGVLQSCSGRGIGTRLFQALDQWATESGVTRLELTVNATNMPARHLYEKSGFEVEGTRHRALFIDGRYYDEFYMAKLF